MKIKNLKIYGLKESIIRSSYPMQIGEPEEFSLNFADEVYINNKDEIRANKLAKVPSGTGHDNFLKGIIVQFDLQYPEYFSPQLQRYNWIDIISSQSKMHRITSRLLIKDDFTEATEEAYISLLNQFIILYQQKDSDKKRLFKSIISNLPSGYLKWMGISTSYLQLKTIYFQRRYHKLQEWQDFCDWIETLPMSELIIDKNE